MNISSVFKEGIVGAFKCLGGNSVCLFIDFFSASERVLTAEK